MAIISVNPATGRVVKRFEPFGDRELEARLERASTAFRAWRIARPEERAAHLARLADLLDAEKETLARLLVEEMGKTILAAHAEVDKCAWACRHYAEHGAKMLEEEVVAAAGDRSSITYLPLGPVLAVMPWNFPFWQVIRFAVPALTAGNVGLLKHASNVPRCALTLEDLFRRAGFPEGVFQTLLLESERVAAVIADPRVKAVTVTGSDAAGAAVAEQAGRHLKKTVMELGGSDPFVVMPSADLPRAIETAVKARTINNGQSCIAAKRFIVHEAVYDAFAAGLCEGLGQLRVGHPLREDTDVGPLATERGRDLLVEQIRSLRAAGARVLVGAEALPGAGFFFLPGAIADVPRASPAAREEIFGPVALLYTARNLDEAIQIANESPFGLGSAAWTRDPEEAARFVRDLETGITFVNGMVSSDPRLPFGGVKRSGWGRELGVFGIRELVNVKTVVASAIGSGTR